MSTEVTGEYEMIDPLTWEETGVQVRPGVDGVFFIDRATGGTLANVEACEGDLVVYVYDADAEDFTVISIPISRGGMP